MGHGELEIHESLLSRIWKGQWVREGKLSAVGGEAVQVVSPGRENRDSGPDYLGAAILIDNATRLGDVELHLKSSDWVAHGHHRNPRFNSAILHVVLWADDIKPTQLQNGQTIPTLALRDYLDGSLQELSARPSTVPSEALPCHGAGYRLGQLAVGELLDHAGEERFYLKAASFEISLILEEPAQVLYEGVMVGLGYAKNKEPFRRLARCLPLRVLAGLAEQQDAESRSLVLQAILLGAAGLLPSLCQHRTTFDDEQLLDRLERMWLSLDVAAELTYADWNFFRVHYRNFPTRRLLAAGSLVDRYLGSPLHVAVFHAVTRSPATVAIAALDEALVVGQLLGQGRARVLEANVILPFCLAWVDVNRQSRLRDRILAVYRAVPALAANQTTRHLSCILWPEGQSTTPMSAQRQQGLLHISRTFCTPGKCDTCPVAAGGG